MASRNTEILVGITVLAALAVVIWSVTYLREVRLAQGTDRWLVRFNDVGGLAADDPVTVNGVKKGAVKEIRLGKGEVLVEFILEKDVSLTTASAVYVRNVGLMGEKFIAIDRSPGGRPLAAGRDTIRGVYEYGIPEVISQMGDALVSLQNLSDSIDRLIAIAEEKDTFKTTLSNVESASHDLRRTLSESREDFDAALDHLRAASESGRRIVESSESRVTRTFDSVDRTSAHLDSLIARVDSLALVMTQVASKINTGNSTAAKLVNERQLYDEMRGTMREVSALVRDLRTNPQKYFKVSVF